MSKKTTEQLTPTGGQAKEIEYPEEKEDFEGQKILIIGGPDAHGVSMAVASAQYLEKRGAQAVIYVGSPVIRGGEGATHPGAFYTKTIPKLDIEGFDRVVICDIPLDSRNLSGSEQALAQLDERIQEDRERRGHPPLAHSTFYLDHHGTTQFSIPIDSIVVKNVPTAEACKLGDEETIVGRIGAICDRDEVALAKATEEEKMLARGLDIAVRPETERPKLADFLDREEYKRYKEALDDWLKAFQEEIQQRSILVADRSYEEFYQMFIEKRPKPMASNYADRGAVDRYNKALAEWEDTAQARLEEAVKRLKGGDWDYFRREAESSERLLNRIDIPTASGFGRVIIVDTEGLTGSFSVMKLMEKAIENAGPAETPYAIAIVRSLEDEKMGRPPADLITIIRYAPRDDLPTVEEVITGKFGKDFFERYKMYGAKNAKTMRLPVNDRETAKIAAELVEVFAGQEMPDLSHVRSVVICGDPNSGKSVYSTIFREALKTLGVRVSHLDLDKAAPTPQWYLDAEIAFKEAEFLFSQGKLSQEKVNEAKQKLEEAAEKRRAMKRPWSIDLAEEAKQELLAAAQEEEIDFVIGDIGGGRIKKDEQGKIVKITRLTAENAKILEGADAVIIVSNNPQGAAEWKRLIETGIDPETGVRIQRDRPIKIIGIYQSILEGGIQETATDGKPGIITNLDRSKAGEKYNPAIFTTAMFVSKAVERRRQ